MLTPSFPPFSRGCTCAGCYNFTLAEGRVAYMAACSSSWLLSAGLWWVTMLLLLLVKEEPTSPVLLPFLRNSFFASASLRSWLGSLTRVPNFGATFLASATCCKQRLNQKTVHMSAG